VWCEWLAPYWRRRTQGDPVTLADEEADAFAALAPNVSIDDFPSAVTLVAHPNRGCSRGLLGCGASVTG
jgi:hypothetical protein